MKKVTIFSILFAAAILSGSAFSTAAEPKEKEKAKTAEIKKGAHYKNVGVDYFEKLRASKTNIVLDVRTKKEFEEGHIPGAVLIDFRSPEFEKEIKQLDPGKTYLVHCAVGGRSAQACEKLEKLKFPNIYNLEGGFKAWEKEGKPVEKGRAEKPKK